MTFFALSFVCALFVTFLVVHLRDFHFHLSADHDLVGVQKMHEVAVPRVGGFGVFLSLVCTAIFLWVIESPHLQFYLLFLLPATLIFTVGLLEDLTKRVSVRARLSAAMLAALAGCFLIDSTVRTFGVDVIDSLFQINLIAVMFTMVAVAGVSNAVNLIDGFNGLSGVVTLVALLALSLVSYLAGDQLIFMIALATAGGVAGFLVWNYPNAKVFLGDGGAYLIGFVIAELSVLVHERNPEVSVLFPLLLMIYPIFETLFTIYRRKFIQGRSPGAPDALHLHQVINKRLVRWNTHSNSRPLRSRGNAMTSPYLWVLSAMATVPAVLFWNNSLALAAFIALFAISYVWVYSRLIKFKTPSLLSFPLKKARVHGLNKLQTYHRAHRVGRSEEIKFNSRTLANIHRPAITLSVVSHGQGQLIRNLFADLRQGLDVTYEVILTLNIPEDELFISEYNDLPLRVIRNSNPKGFGANHNAAFTIARGKHFAVVNPDIRATPLRVAPLLQVLENTNVGACGPVVHSAAGTIEDSARRFPTFTRLAKRVFLGIREPDYEWHDSPIEVDWLAGMFVVFRHDSFELVGGFDERFFMYLEDSDICKRLQKHGRSTVLQPSCTVIHEAQRASRRSARHLRWHLTSAFRFLTGL